MPIVHKKFRLETKRIETVVDQSGHKSTSWASLDCRVLDEATGMPIGLVLHVRDGVDSMKYEAIPLYTNSGEPLAPPSDGWGPEFYKAAEELWKQWNRTLPRATRLGRYLARWLDLYWWAIGVVMGFVAAWLLHFLTNGADSGVVYVI